MPNNRKEKKYISLLEAARIYGCTQKHMALMAREKKLKAIKLGRNWLTTIDWLKEYNKAIEENNKKRQIKKAPVKKVIFTPQTKSVFRKAIAVSLISLLVFAFIGTAYVVAKKRGLSLDPAKQFVSKIISLDFQSPNFILARIFYSAGKTFDLVFHPYFDKTKKFSQEYYTRHLASVFDKIKIIDKQINQKVNQFIWQPLDVVDIAKTIARGFNRVDRISNQFFGGVFKDTFSFISKGLAFIDNLFIKTGNFVINFISNTSKGIVKGPLSFGRFVVNVFQDLPQSLKKFFTFEPFILGFPFPDTSEQSYIAIKDIYKKLSDIRKEVGEKEIIITETVQKIVQEITVVKPVEIRKEIEVIKDQAVLDDLKASILAEVDVKISAIEITDFESMTFHRDSLWANIGSFSTALGTGGAFSAFGPVTLGGGEEEVTVDATNWDVDDSGNITASDITASNISLATLTASGDVTASGDITGSGALTIAGQLTAASTSFDTIDATTLALDKIPTIISEPVLLIQPTDVSGSWATGSAAFLGINASSSFAGNFADFRIDNTSKFFIDEAGNLGAAGVGQFGGTATLSYSRFGTGTTGHSLADSDDLLISGMLEVDATASFDGQAVFYYQPTLLHSFDPWPTGGTSNVLDATLLINPLSAEADTNLLGLAVNGNVKFLVDADGDIYGANLILTGSTTTGETIAGNLIVQDSTTLGDASGDTLTVNATINKYLISSTGLAFEGALQIGSTSSVSYSRFGTGTTDGHGLSEVQDLLISGMLETASDSWFGSNVSVSGNFDLGGRFVADTAASHSFIGDLAIGDDLVVTGDISFGTISIDISDNTNLAVGATGIELSDDNIILSADYVIPLTASTSNWELTYDWKVASESYYDTAYQERGSEIAGTGLSWDGSELDVGGLDFSELVDGMTLDNNLTVASATYSTIWNSDFTVSDVFTVSGTIAFPDDSVAEADVAFSTACAAGNHYYLSGNDLACEADDDTTYTAGGTLLDLTTGTFSINEGTLTDDAICNYDTTGTQIECTITDNSSNWNTAFDWKTTSESFYDDAYQKRVTTWTSPLGFSAGTASITQADTDNSGYLSDTDWDTFNNKEGAVSWANLTVGGTPLTITGGTNAVADATAITFNYDTDIFSLDGNDLTIASASYWELTYDWKVASESYYDTAYQERGSEIAGTGLTWDGSELDVGGLDFSELVDSMTLDAHFSIASAGYSWDFTDIDVNFEGGIWNTLGYIGINDVSPGAMLEIQDDDSSDYLFAVSSSSVGDLFNIASTGYIEMGIAGSDVYIGESGNPANLIIDTGGDGGVLDGAFCVGDDDLSLCPGGDTDGTLYYDAGTSQYDIAEEFYTKEKLEPGDVVVASDKKETVELTDMSYDSKLIGVVSTYPNILFRLDGWSSLGDKSVLISEEKAPVALVGRVPVKISTENGTIEPGDYLTSSNVLGVAMKATQPGSVIGKALEFYNNPDPEEIGTIIVFVAPGWYGGELTETGTIDFNIDVEYSPTPLDFFTNLVNGLKQLGVTIKNGVIEAVKLVVDEVKTKILRANTISITIEPDQDNVVGTATFPAQSIEYRVENSLVEENSKIFISFTSDTEGKTWHISEKVPEQGFTIRLSEVTPTSLTFDYWIVLVEESETDIIVPEPQPLQPSSEGEGQAETASQSEPPLESSSEDLTGQAIIEEEPVVEEPIVEEEPVIEESIAEEEPVVEEPTPEEVISEEEIDTSTDTSTFEETTPTPETSEE